MQSTDEFQPQPGPRSGGRPLRDAITGAYVGGDDDKPDERGKVIFATDFAAEIKSANGKRVIRVAEGWRSMLPPGSKWEPGMLGKADCAMCLGLGWVRFDLPAGHPRQGKLAACECRRRDYPRLKSEGRPE